MEKGCKYEEESNFITIFLIIFFTILISFLIIAIVTVYIYIRRKRTGTLFIICS